MINLAVIEMKDIIKYLVRITIIISIVVVLTRYFSDFRTKIQNGTEEMREHSFLSCLNMVIPSIGTINQKEEQSTSKNIGPLKMALEVELGMMDSLTTKEKQEQEETMGESEENPETKSEEEEVVEAKTGVETQVQESSVPEKFTSTYKTVKIKNETKIKLTEEILTPNVKINTKNILIYHTHTCESYTQSEKYTYKASGNFRTTDTNRSII